MAHTTEVRWADLLVTQLVELTVRMKDFQTVEWKEQKLVVSLVEKREYLKAELTVDLMVYMMVV